MPPEDATQTLPATYPTAVALLTMLGVEQAARFTPEKATAKLAKLLARKGVPDGLTVEQQALVEQLGFNARETLAGDPPPPEGQTEAAADPNVAVPFRLKGRAGEKDRVENITPAIAASRNFRRKNAPNDDGRRWEIDLTAKVTDPPDEQAVEVTETKPVPNKETPVATTATKKKGGKGASTPKAAKATTKDKTAKATPAPKAKATNGTGRGASAKFKELLEGGEKLLKQAVIDKTVAAGASPGTAGSYIVWAKRPLSLGKNKNPFGFRIEETKDEAGKKYLQRVGKKGK